MGLDVSTVRLPRVWFGEGNTPLIPANQIAQDRAARLYFKLENCNPSGSYKDRFVSAEVGRAMLSHAPACVAVSSGNTGAALAACCTRYGIGCLVVVGESISGRRLAQLQAYGAAVVRIPDFGVDPDVSRTVLDQSVEFTASHGLPLVVNSYRYCPAGMGAVELIAREISEHCLGVRHVFMPVGGGGLFSAVARGFLSGEMHRPLVHAVQPEGCLTVVASWREEAEEVRPVRSRTSIHALSVPINLDAGLALGLLRQGRGAGYSVTDEEVFAAQRMLLRREGVYAEPAGAVALAGYLQALNRGTVRPEEPSVCLVTGGGFKDLSSLPGMASANTSSPASVDALTTTLVSLLGKVGAWKDWKNGPNQRSGV